MNDQPVPPYQATTPEPTQPMAYHAEKDSTIIQQTHANPQTASNQTGGHDIIERVNVELVL